MAFYLTLMGSRGEGWCQGSPESHGLCPVLGRSLERIGGRSSGGILLTRAHGVRRGVHQGNNTPPTPRLRAPSVMEESLGRAVKCSRGPPGQPERCSLALLGAGEQTQGSSELSWAWSYCLSPRLHSPPESKGAESFPPSRWGWVGQLPEAEKEVDRSAL